ncbi:XRE family transcriptional regulator [Streptomyces sp. RKND-216]|uniref:MmyB family transcriptional regulator n=1 Tax=Streptomyces sp. RKND-216 TaxID=2562581 RepID=UPI00109D97E0|nr:helix-turn-helix domain-containing protein [Streptomyces sp. RKND-216]THA24382.1 XRE family transcriptional regulator [Streptomyces sp. RKND-216]
MKRAGQPEKLQNLLRAARARVSPEQVGLTAPADPRGRHAEGLTQNDMDTLLAARPDTYARLERGKIQRPSRELLEGVGRALELTAIEWRELWAYALGQEPPDVLDPHADTHIPQVWHRICGELASMAYIISGDWTLLGHNPAFTELFPDARPPSNVLRWMLLDDEARGRTLVDWETAWAPAVMAQLRIAHAARPYQHTLTRIVHEVMDDPVAGPLYRRDPRAEMHPDGDVRPLHHPRLGPGHAHIGAANLIAAAGARFMVVHFTPGPAAPALPAPAPS